MLEEGGREEAREEGKEEARQSHSICQNESLPELLAKH